MNALAYLTYNDVYGFAPDGGAPTICCACMGGFLCASFPKDKVRSCKNLLCGECREAFSVNKEAYQDFVRKHRSWARDLLTTKQAMFWSKIKKHMPKYLA